MSTITQVTQANGTSYVPDACPAYQLPKGAELYAGTEGWVPVISRTEDAQGVWVTVNATPDEDTVTPATVGPLEHAMAVPFRRPWNAPQARAAA